jgi:hypothetical protein
MSVWDHLPRFSHTKPLIPLISRQLLEGFLKGPQCRGFVAADSGYDDVGGDSAGAGEVLVDGVGVGLGVGFVDLELLGTNKGRRLVVGFFLAWLTLEAWRGRPPSGEGGIMGGLTYSQSVPLVPVLLRVELGEESVVDETCAVAVEVVVICPWSVSLPPPHPLHSSP